MTASALNAPTRERGDAHQVSAHLPVLLLGLRWLYDTDQPAHAIAGHDGQAMASAGGRILRFIPRGRVGFATIRIEIAAPTTDTQPLSTGEIAAFADLLDDLGVTAEHTWIEYPGTSGCLALRRPAHPALRETVARYQRGCPVHRHQHRPNCRWYTAGTAALVGLPQLQQQVLAASAALPTLAGPWPTYLDPSGLLSHTAATLYRSKALPTTTTGDHPHAQSGGSGVHQPPV